MKKIITIILSILRGFFVNPFWKSKLNIVILAISLAISAVLWYIYAVRIHSFLNYFLFASGIIVINTILANMFYNRERILSLILLFVALFSQLLIISFIRFLFISF